MNRYEFYDNVKGYKETKEDSLVHYGIIGQKWGTRRWQNQDGTFNEEGKIRYFGKSGKSRHEGTDKNWGNRAEEYTNRLQKAKTYKEIDNIENEILNDKHIKPYYDEAKKIYKETGDWNKVDEYILNTPIQQEDWIYDMVESHAKKESTSDQKIGSVASAIIGIRTGIDNYKNMEQLKNKYDAFIDASDQDYNKDELFSIMHNKKRIAEMEGALNRGDTERYDKIMKKVKDEDKEAVEKFIKDINTNAMKKEPIPKETQDELNDTLQKAKLGSLTKPAINQKYLNPDGTLNDLGLKNTERNRKHTRVWASIFNGLRNANIYSAAVSPLLFAIMAGTGVGLPAAIGIALGQAAGSSAAAAIDHAVYKRLEDRADRYYTELKTRV